MTKNINTAAVIIQRLRVGSLNSLQQLANFSAKLKLVLGLLTVLSLISACSGRDDVITQDDSADYRSARALPPLKKPSPRAISKVRSIEVQESEPQAASGATPPPEVQAEEVAASPAPVPSLNSSQESSQRSPEIEPKPLVLDQETSIPARIVQAKSGHARLLLETDSVDLAWNKLNQDLRSSTITVHSRNKAAGRFSIGCGSETTPSEPVKKSKWSIFKKDTVTSEYCTLQMAEGKTGLVVSAYDTNGSEYAAPRSTELFSELLNK